MGVVWGTTPEIVEAFGDGFGFGYGFGDGYGSGSGYGSGDGYGDGDQKKTYLEAILSQHASKARGCELAFWRSTDDGYPANGGGGLARVVGTVENVKGPLVLCGSRALHATLSPEKWKGVRWWVVALQPPVIKDADKMGSLKRTIIADLGKCPF